MSFHFSLAGKIDFRPITRISTGSTGLFRNIADLSVESLDNLVFHIGMIELISYWKAACPPELRIMPHALSREQEAFWRKTYYLGLGEFFFMNSIDVSPDNFVRFIFPGQQAVPVFGDPFSGGSLVPVGGGKDSAVTLELARKAGLDHLPFVLGQVPSARDVIRAAGFTPDETVHFDRILDSRLLQLNEQGFLNGHTPFSALLGFYSLLAAYLTGRPHILLSNESSANEPTVPGTDINHQYSKSFEFEKDFRDYYTEHISSCFDYYSLLRPLTELQIAQIFSALRHFHPVFKSCNAGSKTASWCGKCPKCLFTAVMLLPFLEPEELTRIFGRDILDDPTLLPILEELAGRREIRPFDCIGTPDEVNAALKAGIARYRGKKPPALLEAWDTESFPEMNRLSPTLNADHFVPDDLLKIIRETLA